VVLDTGTPAAATADILMGVVADKVAQPSMMVLSNDLVTDHEQSDQNSDAFLDPYTGHGVFISGLIDDVAPGALIVNSKSVRTFGDVDDFELGAAIEAALVRLGRAPVPSTGGANDLAAHKGDDLVINLSVSGYCEDDDPPVVTESVIGQLLGQKGPSLPYTFQQTEDVVVVASAGNNASCRPSWPAAFDHVVSVAALNGSVPAWFTNWGGWVRACAPGVDLLGRFLAPTNQPSFSDLDDYCGWAQWSGTSFSAPLVAATIAWEVMSAGTTPAAAVERLIDRPGLYSLYGLGTVVNVL
jgi:subtilisin family serine protease